MNMRSAIVIGGTDSVGNALIRLLCDSEEYVSITVISTEKVELSHAKLTVKIREIDEIEEKDFEFAHEIFCCVNWKMKASREEYEKNVIEYPLHIASLAKKRGIMNFILLSSANANSTALSYEARVKGKLEEQLISLNLPQVSIVRPFGIVGESQGVKKVLSSIKKFNFFEPEQLAIYLKLVALFGKKGTVTEYSSAELLELKMPEPEEEEAIIFNWDKYKLEESEVVDREVVFKRHIEEGKELSLFDKDEGNYRPKD